MTRRELLECAKAADKWPKDTPMTFWWVIPAKSPKQQSVDGFGYPEERTKVPAGALV